MNIAEIINIIKDALSNEVNIIFVVIILILAFFDLKKGKDLKSQIVSIGVLGTFVGIFIGLQDFNPEDMKNSINHILVGLKTAFFTSIVGMITATGLAVYQRLSNEYIDDERNEERILLDISEKLNKLDDLGSGKGTDKIIGELERIRAIQIDTRDGIKNISCSINELRDNSNKENQELISILNNNFDKMNNSLEIAIEKLSKGATEEIINALKIVIEDFNQELQTQFGENFVKLNEAVLNLVDWQNNYKNHIETLDEKLQLSSESIEKSKESLEIISSKNEDILNVYKELQHIIDIYDRQIKELNQHLKTYANLSNSAESMFSTISNSIDHTKKEFIYLAKIIAKSNEVQRKVVINSTKEIKNEYNNLTQHIKLEHTKQKDNAKQTNELMADDLKTKTTEIYADLSNSAESMFSTILHNIDYTKEEFTGLANIIAKSNELQRKSFIHSTKEIKNEYNNLTQHIKLEHTKQKDNAKQINKSIANDLKIKSTEISKHFDDLTNSFEKNRKELDLVSSHFKSLGEQIPKALQVSLEELNRGLTSLTTQFQKDYKDIMDNYKGNN